MSTIDDTSQEPAVPRTAPEVDFDHHGREYAENWVGLTHDLRGKCPVVHTAARDGFYVVTGYPEVARMLGDDATFSSARALPGDEIDEDNPIGITIPASPFGSVPIDLDPPDNEPYRRLLNPLFSPAASAKWAPFVKEAVNECIDGIIETGRGDFILDIANPIPALLTLKFMGLPLEDWRYYAEPMHAAVFTPPGTPAAAKVEEQSTIMMGKIYEAVQARKADPGEDDLITKLVQAEIDGEPISDPVIMQILFLVLVGGVDTTTALMANTFRWLGQHPEERARYAADPALANTAREEFLRYFAPTQALARTVTGDTELAGVPLHRGDRVMMSFAAANRDPAVFPDPDAIVLDRKPNRHTTFGLGVHRCIGSNIARVEFDVAMREVLRRMPDYVIDEAGSKSYETIGVVNGWESMPFTFTPGAKEGASVTSL